MNEAAIGSLTLRQQQLSKTWLPTRQYDLIIAGLSWEPRCLTATQLAGGHVKAISLIKFKSNDTATDFRKKATKDAFDRIVEKVNIVELDTSIETTPNFKKIETWMRDKYVSIGRPMRILLDMSCLPKTYLLFMLGLGFTRDYFACFDCLYSEGIFDLNAEDNEATKRIGGPRTLISEGEWRSRQIPYLEPRDIVATERDVIVNMGGEVGLSLPFIEKFEPRRLGLIFIGETAPDISSPMLQSEKSALMELLSEPNAERVDIPLADVIGVATHAVKFSRDSTANIVTGIAIGSKPHALALGVAALAEDKMELVCRTPSSYKPTETLPSGRVFLFEIEDRFEPCSYL